MGYSEDAIATAVLEIFDSLPAKLKPVKPTAEIFQWTSLSGIIAVKGLYHVLWALCRGLDTSGMLIYEQFTGRGQKPECLSLG